MDAVTATPVPRNEPQRTYAPGSGERVSLQAALAELAGRERELPVTVDGRRYIPCGPVLEVVAPHDHAHVLGVTRARDREDAEAAVEAALQAAPAWRDLPFDERAAVLLRAADLLAGPWRDRLNAATMLGQSKTGYQAEIDAACELIDFWRFNVALRPADPRRAAVELSRAWNRFDHRPLEGFVYAITPFNFTAIAGNLPTAPALMGNTVIWKPSPTQTLAAVLTLQLLEEAGLPPGVINMLTGDGLASPRWHWPTRALAGIHFTGSTATFRHLWREVGSEPRPLRNLSAAGRRDRRQGLRGRPPASADPTCCAPRWSAARSSTRGRSARRRRGRSCRAACGHGCATTSSRRPSALPIGDVEDFRNFMGAVIDRRSFDKTQGVTRSIGPTPTRRWRSWPADDRRLHRVLRASDARRRWRSDQRRVLHRVLRTHAGGARVRRRRLTRRCWTRSTTGRRTR